MRFPLAAGVVAAVAMSVITGSHTASAASSSAHWTQATTATTSVSDVVAEPSAIGTPITSGGSCVLTSGHAFRYGSVWTCWVVLYDGIPPFSQHWTAVGPTSCAGPAWTCKTTFSPSSGTVGENGEWVKIKTAIGNCAGYTLAFNTTTGPLDIPVSCSSTAPGPSLVADPTDIGLPGDADGWCVLTSGVRFQQGDVFTCYVALFANSSAPVPWIAAGPAHCGWECKTTFSPSYGVAGAGGIWVKIKTAIGYCANYTLSFKNPLTTVRVPVYCG
jgi:hypothetical protein